MMKIYITGVYVDDQAKALDFYTEKLGFEKKVDIPIGEKHRWLTVTAPGDADGVQLLLEPAEHPAVKPYREALMEDGIPLASFQVDDVEAECDRLRREGVEITQPPTDVGTAIIATIDDTCGNLVQLLQMR